MGYSDEDRRRKKKKKKHSRSRSPSADSRHSSKHKSKRSKHKRDVTHVSPPRRHRSRSVSLPRKRQSRSRSVSPPRKRPDSRVRRSRSREARSRSPGSRGSSSRQFDERIHSRERRSRSRERYQKSSRSRRSRSRSKDSSKDSRASSMDKRRSPGKDKDKSFERINDPCKDIPGFKDMTPVEQAQMRMQMALKAAAAADEKLKGHSVFDATSGRSAEEQLRFSRAIDDINSDSFAPTSFLSSRTTPAESSDIRSMAEKSHDAAIFGSIDDVFELKPELMPKIVYKDPESFAHPNLHKTVEEKMPRWIEKLTAMRRRKLEGDL